MNDPVADLSVALCDVVNSYAERVSVSEIIGVLELVKHVYITEALKQDDTNEDDTE